jgi:translation initiation factor 1
VETKNKKHRKGIVYSTDPSFVYDYGNKSISGTLPPEEQRLRIILDTKGRQGKVATLIKGFVGKERDIEQLAKTIKTRCGTGGTVKDGDVIIQGDMRDRISEVLAELGYCWKAS